MNSQDSIQNASGTSPRITVRVDAEQDINRFLFFLNSATYRTKRSRILGFYPTLHDRVARGENEQTVVREMVTDMYQRYRTQLDQIVRETTAEFSQASMAFAALARIMHFPELGQRSYTAIPTFLPFSPLDQKQFYFSIAMAIAKGRTRPLSRTAVAIHEISHFIFFEQYNAWRQTSQAQLSDPTYHYFKEGLTAAVMDQPEFRSFFNYQELYQSAAYPGNPELHDLRAEVHGKTLGLIDVFNQEVLHCPDGYVVGLHRLCQAFTDSNDTFRTRCKLWNDVGGSFEHRSHELAVYQKPIRLEIRV